MKLLSFLFVAILSTAALADSCDTMTPLGKPTVTTTEHVTRLCRKMYVLEHSPSRHTAYWSAEHLLGVQENAAAERVNAFKTDPNLPKNEASTPGDYSNTGYDQGHMSPVGDMHTDATAMLESFYMSNMSPQVPGNNRNGWNHLEAFVRSISVARGDVYVITGPVYVGGIQKTIGKTKVAVPSHFYKIVYDSHTNATMSFLVPNIPFTEQEIPKYLSTLKAIQDATGVKFFPSATTPIVESTHVWTAKAN